MADREKYLKCPSISDYIKKNNISPVTDSLLKDFWDFCRGHQEINGEIECFCNDEKYGK